MPGGEFLMTLQLTTQGNVKGSSTKKKGDLDFSQGMECHAYSYGVSSPIDHNTGQPVGVRKHGTIVIRRGVDAASPKLLQALCTNETFKTAKLSFNRTSSNGKPTLAYTIELTNGAIVDIKHMTDSSGKRYQDLTLEFDDWLVNGLPNGIIPHSRFP
jgi:type VI secretion system Hcp family effector